MYETRAEALLPRARFIGRLARHAAAAAALVAASLGMGMSGYVYFEHLSWLDAFVAASPSAWFLHPCCTAPCTGST